MYSITSSDTEGGPPVYADPSSFLLPIQPCRFRGVLRDRRDHRVAFAAVGTSLWGIGKRKVPCRIWQDSFAGSPVGTVGSCLFPGYGMPERADQHGGSNGGSAKKSKNLFQRNPFPLQRSDRILRFVSSFPNATSLNGLDVGYSRADREVLNGSKPVPLLLLNFALARFGY